MKIGFALLAAATMALYIGGCALIGFQSLDDVVEVAELFDEYLAIKVVSGAESGDDALLDDEDRANGQWAGNASIATATREIDDNGTPSDPTDDVISITRETRNWNGLLVRQVVQRPLRPDGSTVWDHVWNEEMRYRQVGSIEVFLENFLTPHKIGTIGTLWEKGDQEIVLLEITKSTESLDGSGSVIDELVIIDPVTGSRSKTETRYRVVGGELIVVSVVTYETIENGETGEVFYRIVSDRRDGYALVTRDGDTRIAEFYTDDNELELVVTQVRNSETGRLEIRRDFYLDGEIIRTVEGTVQYRFDDGVLTIIREREGEGSGSVTITESEDGFRIEKDGVTYFVTVEDGQMTIATDRGTYLLSRTAGAWNLVA